MPASFYSSSNSSVTPCPLGHHLHEISLTWMATSYILQNPVHFFLVVLTQFLKITPPFFILILHTRLILAPLTRIVLGSTTC